MGRPDALSWRSDHPHGKDDNANITLLPSNVFKVHNTEATLVDSRGNELVEHIWRSTDYNNTVVKALRELGAGTLQSDEWERDGDLVMYRGCMYVPKDPQLCHDIVHTHHDSMMTSQGGGRHWSWSPTITGGWASPAMLPAMWQGAMSATAASPPQHRRWGSLPQTS